MSVCRMTIQKKLPFKAYTVINCSVATSLGSPDVYRFFVLSLTADRDNFTDTTLEQLADFTGEKVTAYKGGICGGKKRESLTERFKSSNEFESITSEKEISNLSGKVVSRNHYVFRKAETGYYRRISKEFRELDLPIKLKGYLLQLFCLTEPHCLLVKKTCNMIAVTLKMAHNTVRSYNQILEGAGLLEMTEEGFLLKSDAFIIDDPARILKPEYQEYIDWMEHVDIPGRIEEAERKRQPVQLTDRERMYLNYKEKDFKGIRNKNNFMHYCMTGLRYRPSKPVVNLYPPIIL